MAGSLLKDGSLKTINHRWQSVPAVTGRFFGEDPGNGGDFLILCNNDAKVRG
jgi:hypothetical protein